MVRPLCLAPAVLSWLVLLAGCSSVPRLGAAEIDAPGIGSLESPSSESPWPSARFYGATFLASHFRDTDDDGAPRASRERLDDTHVEVAAKSPALGGSLSEERADERLLERCEARRSIVVHKAARRLELRCGTALAGRYEASLGFTPEGHKLREGDGRTPEGEYRVTGKYPSRFHRALQLSYPNVADAEHGLATGTIDESQYRAIVRANRSCGSPPQNTALGSWLQIHGGGGGRDDGDWTLGCVAVDNPEIEQVFAFHRAGCDAEGEPFTRVLILP
ncbi:MAG: L,D-transpeptidase family protein [Deltaproteobacteria bacterium]|nr:L,D-transpeptidase family protein [Deltaproteobacteria bacterium]